MLNRLLNIVWLARFRRTGRTGPRARLYIFERAGPTLGVKLAVGPIDVKKLMPMTHAELRNGPAARPSARASVGPCPFHLVTLNPCPAARCPGRRTHRHTRSPPP